MLNIDRRELERRRNRQVPPRPRAPMVPDAVIRGCQVFVRPNGAHGTFEARIILDSGAHAYCPGLADAEAALAAADALIQQLRPAATEQHPVQVPAPPAFPAEPGAASAAPTRLPCVTLYTDGSNYGQPGPGGWGALLVVKARGQVIEKALSGPIESATNNIAELSAVIGGLRALTQPCRVKVVSDSEYVVNGINGLVQRWAARGWRTATNDPVKNQDLWQLVLELMQQHAVIAEWVRGHNGHPENERVDQLARTQAKAEKARQDARAIARASLATKPALLEIPPKRLQWLCEPEARADYHAIIDGPVTLPNAKVLSDPWRLGGKGGPWVTAIEGQAGCVSVDALTKIKAPKRQKAKA